VLIGDNSFRLGQTNSEYYIVWSRCVMVCIFIWSFKGLVFKDKIMQLVKEGLVFKDKIMQLVTKV